MQKVPKVVRSFVKTSLSWLGFAQQPDPELEREPNATNGDFEFLPAAEKDLEQEPAADVSMNESAPQKGDLRDSITSQKTGAGNEDLTRHPKVRSQTLDDSVVKKRLCKTASGRRSAQGNRRLIIYSFL